MKKPVKLAIKSNNTSVYEDCAICGVRFEPAIGSELFLANSFEGVCDECGKKNAPDLYMLLRIGRILKEDNF